jgi:hypothetical protein
MPNGAVKASPDVETALAEVRASRRLRLKRQLIPAA